MAALGHELHYPDLDRPVRGGGGGPRSAPGTSSQRLHGAARRRGAGRGGPRRAGHAVHGARQRSGGDAGVVVRGHDGDVGDLTKLAALLHPGARRRHPGLRHPRRRHLACTAWTAPTPATCRAARAAGRGRVGGVAGLGVPRRHPGRGARPAPAAVRHHQGARRREGQHPVGVGDDAEDRVAISRFSFEMGDPEHLGHVLRRCATSRASTTSTASRRGRGLTTRLPRVPAPARQRGPARGIAFLRSTVTG